MEYISVFISFVVVFSVCIGGLVFFAYPFIRVEEIFGEGFVSIFLVILGLSGIFTTLYYIK